MRNSKINWNFPDPIPIPGDFQLMVGGSSLVAKTLYRRGLTSPDEALAFLNQDLYQPAPSSDMPGIIQGSERVLRAIEHKEQILIWGDFDVDGQTSTSLLVSGLNKLGAKVHHHIPVRAQESHGISLSVLEEKISAYSPQLIITCDTGIDAVEAVSFASRSAIDVVITDHHQLPPELPEALAIINPNLLPHDHPLFNLPGVGVAYKLIEQVYAHYSLDPSFLLDLVALGIVADVAIQTKDTRHLLQKGLNILRNSPRLGLSEIYKTNKLFPEQITEDHIGYVIGPRLNALGRLDDANSCVEFFTTDDPVQATLLANRLEELNRTRQLLTEQIFNESVNMIAAYPELVEDYPVLVLQGSPTWNPGVIGIVASRLVERYHKPTIMLSRDGDLARGSARSIPGVPISKLISTTEDLLTSHGGHPMAAGVSLPLANVSQFRRSIADNYRTLVGDETPDITIHIDSEITFQAINESLIKDFHRLAPFGAGNPKLIFASRGVFTDEAKIKTIGRTGNHRKITFSDSNGDEADFLWWNSADLLIPDMPLDITFSLEISTYRDKPQIQATLLHLRQSPGSSVYLPKHPHIEIIDLRNSKDLLAEAFHFHEQPNTIIWAENNLPGDLPSVPRSMLSKCDTLIIWTTPPDNYVLTEAIKIASPGKIALICENPALDKLEDFINALLGLLKYLKNTGKPLDIPRFCEILAMPEDVVAIGLDWIHHQGDFDLAKVKEGLIEEGPGANLPGFQTVDEKLKHMLREVLAYRSYFKNAHTRAIL